MPLLTKYQDELLKGTVRLSARQSKLLDLFGPTGKGQIRINDLLPADKRTLGSFIKGLKRSRGYVEISGNVARLTPLGKQARATWDQANIYVSNVPTHFPKSFQDQIESLAGEFKLPNHIPEAAPRREIVRVMRKSA